MDHEYEHDRARLSTPAETLAFTVEPGRSSRSAALNKPARAVASGLVQRKACDRCGGEHAPGDAAHDHDANRIHEIADRGLSGAASALPYLAIIQRSFGPEHDLSGVHSYIGGPAAAAAGELGALAYARGEQIAFAGAPSLHTAAHEAAHVVQQRAGVHLKRGVGEVGDRYERNADEVADRVVRGLPARDLLAGFAGDAAAVQEQPACSNCADAASGTTAFSREPSPPTAARPATPSSEPVQRACSACTGENQRAGAKQRTRRRVQTRADRPGEPRESPRARGRIARSAAGRPAHTVVQRQSQPPSGGPVTARISREDGRIIFNAGGGSYSYRLITCDIPAGDYTVGLSIQGSNVHFEFGQSAASGERFHFEFAIEAGQPNPATLLRGQRQLAISVVERAPQAGGPATAALPATSRLAAFQQLVKNAGKVRLAENARALEEWRQFLRQQLTPAQVQTQVHAEEARSLVDGATQRGLGETALVDQWLQTSGPNRRWVMQQQIEGRYRACTGCHATVQADAMDRRLADQGVPLRTPLEQLAGDAPPGPRPGFAPAAPSPAPASAGFPAVAEAQQRIRAVQPYLRTLGPDRYRVLPPETLGSTAPPEQLVADIDRRITQRQANYAEFSHRIDAADFDYLQLRPIVRDLLPLADADVRRAVEDAIARAQVWETVEVIVVGAASIGLLLLAIFPPTSAVGIGGALALGAALGAHQIDQGYQNYEQGRLYSLSQGANDVLDPGQQEAADSMMAMGALNMVLGAVGVASSALGGVRLIRSLPPPGGGAGAGAVEAIEGTAGAQIYQVTGWRTRDLRVTVTGPNGQVIQDRPLSSFRPATASGPQASASGGGSYVYPTDGSAARVAQPVLEPVAPAAPQPTVAPAAPQPTVAPAAQPGAVAPDVRGPLAVSAATAGGGAVTASLAGPQSTPVMPAGLSAADQELWRTCRQLHDTYKATQEEAADYAARMDPIEDRLQNNRATPQDRMDFCWMLDERIRIVQRLHAERTRYMANDCDRFDWFNRGTTAAERRQAHQDELDAVSRQLQNFYALRNRFCP